MSEHDLQSVNSIEISIRQWKVRFVGYRWVCKEHATIVPHVIGPNVGIVLGSNTGYNGDYRDRVLFCV